MRRSPNDPPGMTPDQWEAVRTPSEPRTINFSIDFIRRIDAHDFRCLDDDAHGDLRDGLPFEESVLALLDHALEISEREAGVRAEPFTGRMEPLPE